MRVLLVEPYLGGSHADWAEGLTRHSTHEVVAVGIPVGTGAGACGARR